MHTSIKLDTPVEFVNITPLNSLISKCQIKVCYVGEEPNRNGSVITKEVAKEMANSLPGCPIVGFYNEEKKDFEEHNRIIDISNGNFEIKDVTRPYGFVDLGAKVWFQKYLDDNKNEHEYLMTEGWLWTSQYPECQRILTQSNNQSMELDEESLDAKWSESDNDHPSFFIINEAMISKLCILGEENEPCFEGANISTPTIQFSFEKGFKDQLFSMMNELKELLNEGGEKVFTRYAVEIGDNVWNALYDHVHENYSIDSVCEDEGQIFAILGSEDKYYRLNLSVAEDGAINFDNEYSLMEDYKPEGDPQFNADDVAAYAASKVVEPEDNNSDPEPQSTPEDNNSDPEPENSLENEDKGNKYNLNEIQEYVELSEKYSALETQLAEANTTIESLTTQNAELTQFKAGIEKAEKKKMIDSFYMLSDEDKADVVANIDNYSLDDIEAKLSIICVRNKVSFNLDNDNDNNNDSSSVTFNLNGGLNDEAPAWVKALRSVAKEKDI